MASVVWLKLCLKAVQLTGPGLHVQEEAVAVHLQEIAQEQPSVNDTVMQTGAGKNDNVRAFQAACMQVGQLTSSHLAVLPGTCLGSKLLLTVNAAEPFEHTTVSCNTRTHCSQVTV